jgi:hypothetical protein
VQANYDNDAPIVNDPVLVSRITLDSGFYDGMLRDGVSLVRHGTGTMKYTDGSVYKGEWSDGFLHGEGRMRYSDDSVYEGSWCRGIYHGVGLLVMRAAHKTFDTYDGEVCPPSVLVFLGARMTGIVSSRVVSCVACRLVLCRLMSCHVVSCLVLQWCDGKMHGNGRRHHWNGAVYIGTYANNERHGYGRYTCANGDQYDGMVRTRGRGV